jgi:hypothetical protein
VTDRDGMYVLVKPSGTLTFRKRSAAPTLR